MSFYPPKADTPGAKAWLIAERKYFERRWHMTKDQERQIARIHTGRSATDPMLAAVMLLHAW